jgi:hypothetical protein
VNPGPIGEGRPGKHDRARQIGADRRRHHDLPAGLAIGDDDGLAFRLAVPGGDFLDKDRLGLTDLLDRLSRRRLRQEADEVDGMACAQRDADFALRLHPPDAGAVARAGVDHDDRRLRRIGHNAFRGDDAHERVIDRPVQRAAVPYEFGREVEDVRDLLGGVLAVVVASFTEGVQEQHAALPRVRPIFSGRVEIGRLIRHRRLPIWDPLSRAWDTRPVIRTIS